MKHVHEYNNNYYNNYALLIIQYCGGMGESVRGKSKEAGPQEGRRCAAVPDSSRWQDH